MPKLIRRSSHSWHSTEMCANWDSVYCSLGRFPTGLMSGGLRRWWRILSFVKNIVKLGNNRYGNIGFWMYFMFRVVKFHWNVIYIEFRIYSMRVSASSYPILSTFTVFLKRLETRFTRSLGYEQYALSLICTPRRSSFDLTICTLIQFNGVFL